MIEKMLKASVVCRNEDCESALKELGSMGIMHIEQTSKTVSHDVTTLETKISKVKLAIQVLSGYAKKSKPIEPTSIRVIPYKLTQKVINIIEHNTDIKNKITLYTREREKLLPWGNFSYKTIDELYQKGLHVYLCSCAKSELDKYSAEDRIIEVISNSKISTYFALISGKKIARTELPIAQLPSNKKSLREINIQILLLNKKYAKNERILKNLARNVPKIIRYSNFLEIELEFLKHRDSMANDGKLSYLQGFIPAKRKDILLRTSKKLHWATLLEEPSAEDRVPTMITIPKIFRIVQPVFKFIGISPGYHEWDVSVCFLLFFTIFFAMIVGDAGYGILFFAVALVLKIIYWKNEKYKLPINLFFVLSIATIAWGVLTSSFFGLPQEILPRQLHGIEALTSPTLKDKNIQYLCFLLAGIHLSFARIWKATIFRNSLKALGQIGWALFIWGNFFTAIKLIVFTQMPYPQFAYYLYAIGAILILLFYVQWNNVGSVFNLPFDFIGSFTDVLSYIRLFAVGLASYYIAESFNNMGNMIMHISPYLIVLTIIVLLFGHLLNIGLALMGVLVHGIRLNTLEFSNHMELEWTGSTYKPFTRKHKKEFRNITHKH
jgi:V/A-type H+/Na+-transporting ATPase subunit I